jgi:hypothetical protein
MANSYLSRTISSAGSLTTWTFSAWVKLSEPGTSNCAIFSQGSSGNNVTSIFFNHSNGAHRLEWRQYENSYTARKTTNRAFSDKSGWYHIVCQWDSTNGTAGDRMKIYVNGERETSFENSTDPSSSLSSIINSTTGTMHIGTYWNTSSNLFNGYMSHVTFVNNAIVAPTSFGQADSTTGQWKFKSPSGITFGTNGFHLKMENSGALGTDSSGNSNTFTVNGNLKQALDTPSNVYATLNPLNVPTSNAPTFANGNTTSTTPGSSGRFGGTSTLGMSAGKYYWEAKYVISGLPRGEFGVSYDPGEQARNNATASNYADAWCYQSEGGHIRNNNSNLDQEATYTNGDIVMCALDLTNNKIYFGKNGTWVNSGDPTSGASGTGAYSVTADKTYFTITSDNTSGSDQQTYQFNFGNGFFGTTAITSAGSNGNGSLFEYDCPSGYYALNTKNINTYG